MLVKAARREGTVDVPAGLSEWKGYAALAAGFESRYHVNVNQVAVTGDTAQLAAAESLDVFDVGLDTAVAQKSLLAPYVVFYWAQIPAALKDYQTRWSASCGGYVSIGGAGASASLAQVVSSSSSVALDGTPTESNGALAAVVTASLGAGGSAADVAPGVRLFRSLAQEGRLTRGAADVVFDWNYVFGPAPHFAPAQTVAAYDVQAVNARAAHPAAARLWEEYLFSDGGQNLCMTYGARPSRIDAMRAAGVLDLAAAAKLDPWPVGAVSLTAEQLAAARAYVAGNWNSVVA